MDKDNALLAIRENQELVGVVVERFKIADTWRRPLQDNWNRFYKLYRSRLEETEDSWRANIFIPYCFSTVETILPRLVTNRPRFEFVARGQEDQERAKMVDELLKYQWDITNMDLTMVDWVKEALLYGTAVLKVPWVFDKEHDSPLPQVVDIFDFFIDPRATSIKGAKYVIHRTLRDMDYLRDKQAMGIYKNVDLIQSFGRIDYSKSERLANIGLSDPETDKKSKDVEVLEYWTDNEIIAIANRQTVIRREKNPYNCGKPFVYIVDQKVPHEFYGVGEIESIEGLQDELNGWRNHRMDSKTITMNPMWWVPPGMDLDDFIAEPGAVFSGPQSPKAIETNFDKLSDYREEEIIKGDIQTTTGVSDYSRGVENAPGISNETATGISLIQEAANMRFRMKIMLLEEMGIKELGLMMLKLDQQFIKEPMVIRLLGESGREWKAITPDDIKGEYDIVVETGSTQPMNELMRRKRAGELLTLFANDPDLTEEGRIYLKKQLIESYGVTNSARMFIKPMTEEDKMKMAEEERMADSGAKRRAALMGMGGQVEAPEMGGAGV